MPEHKGLDILYHHRTQGRGAEGVHIVSIVEALEALGHRVTLLSPPGIEPLKTAGNAPVDKSEVRTSGLNSIWKFVSRNLPNFIFELVEIGYNLPAYFRLERELGRNHYDLVYERYAFYLVAGAVASRRRGIPLVLEANEVSGIKDRARKQSFAWLCKRFERFLLARCQSIHTVSSYLRTMILAHPGIDPDRVQVMPNALDLRQFECEPENSELAARLGLQGKTVIGFAGWFDDWDRLDLLLEVFLSLKRENPQLALLLVGDGSVLRPIEARISAERLTDIVLTGAVPRGEVKRYISLLDIAVISHSNEFGSPVVMFEFMGLGIPIVAPALLPITDVLEDRVDALL
ncbi:MAG: glycosyltransferase, partial [Gammaproteobacteria bacterium]